MSKRIKTGVLAGALSGVVGALFFAAAHALLIVPIWERMTSGIAFGALAGAAAGWALAEWYPADAFTDGRRAAVTGARFGATLWLLVAPVTAADALLRYLGIAPRFELVAVTVALTLAAAGGSIFGWVRTHTRRGAISGGAATLALTIAMAGPVPVARSVRAFGIFVAVLPAAILAGTVVALAARYLNRETKELAAGS